MAKKEEDERWLEGRTRHVRVYLTDVEHAIVRQAAALADKSVSRFSIEAVVEAATEFVKKRAPKGGTPEPTAKKSRKRKGE